jgi:parallel beta-helix repeat protein
MYAKNLMRLLVLLLFVFLAHELRAEKATQAEMELVCKNWLSYVVYQKGTWAGESNPQISGVQEITNGDTLLARCYSTAPRGFVVVPILEELPPINTYSDECNFDIHQDFGFPQLVKEMLLNRIRLYSKIYGSLDAVQPLTGDVLLGREHKAEWEKFNQSESSFQSDLARGKFSPLTQVGPLLTTAWHQGAPYNNFCPMGDGGRCVVGCTGTASAQIMKYHEWPPSGTGGHSLTWDGDQSCGGNVGGGKLSATFSDVYDWQNMPNDCQSGCTQAQQDALAELCYEVGNALYMDYGVCGSGAWPDSAIYAFPAYFGYDSSIEREDRDDHTVDSWFSLIQTEINNNRPMLYTLFSYDYTFGHEIVCDGWRDTGGQKQYHMNYGWGGSYTAWYVIDNLYCGSPGCNPMVEYVIRNISPGVRCGCTITRNTVLDRDLLDCPGHGIIIGADGITLDGNGHTIDGDGTEDFDCGISMNSRSNVTIRNCSVKEFRRGIYIWYGSGNTLVDNITNSNDYGITVRASYGNTVTGNTTNYNVTTGIRLDYASSNNTLTYNTADSNGWGGIGLSDTSSGNNIEGNTASYNLTMGIALYYNSSNNNITNNDVVGNVSYGAYLGSASTNNTFWGNHFENNGSYNAFEDYSSTSNNWNLADTGNYWSDCFTNPGYPGYYEIPGEGNGIDYHPDCPWLVGDANGDRIIDVGDVVYLINYLFKGGSIPNPLLSGDNNCDSVVDVGDVVYLINYLFKGGPAPSC